MPILDNDTHSPAVQASAFRLIKLLKINYSSILDVGTADGQTYHNVQRCLFRYLACLSDNPAALSTQNEEILAVKDDPTIAAVIKIIDHISNVPQERLSTHDKKIIFGQLKIIAGMHPYHNWNEHDEQWSINRCYLRERDGDVELMTPPAEALNLVCAALLDCSRFMPNHHEEGRDLSLRIENFYLHWLDLGKQVASGSREKCSAGLQHDLLNLLSGFYLDRDRCLAGARPLPWVTDFNSFLLESLSIFLMMQLDLLLEDKVKIEQIYQTWRDWQINLEESIWPLYDILQPNWEMNAALFIQNRCKEIGINPKHYQSQIQAVIAAAESLLVPPHINVYQVLMEELTSKRFELRMPSTSNLSALVSLSNQALRMFQEQKVDSILTAKPLYLALSWLERLLRYHDGEVIIDEAERAFINVMRELECFLMAYFHRFPCDMNRPLFNEISVRFLEREVVLPSFPENFISDFFIKNQQEGFVNWDSIWIKIKSAKQKDKRHPLILTEETLNQWGTQRGIRAGITPYMINRHYIHGLLVSPKDWTSTYCSAMANISILMLQDPQQLLDQSIKAQYPKKLLVNFLLFVLIHRSNLPQDLKRRCWCVLENNSSEKKLMLQCQGPYKLLSEKDFDTQMKVQLWDMMRPQLNHLILNSDDPLRFFELNGLNAQLDDELLQIIGPELHGFVKVTKDFTRIFMPSSPRHRTIIWHFLYPHLNDLVKSIWHFIALFQLPSDVLGKEQRAAIFSLFISKLKDCSLYGFQLKQLLDLNLEQFTPSQRTILIQTFILNYRQNINAIGKMGVDEIPVNELLLAIQTVNTEGDSILTCIKHDRELLGMILNHLPARERQQIMNANQHVFAPVQNVTVSGFFLTHGQQFVVGGIPQHIHRITQLLKRNRDFLPDLPKFNQVIYRDGLQFEVNVCQWILADNQEPPFSGANLSAAPRCMIRRGRSGLDEAVESKTLFFRSKIAKAQLNQINPTAKETIKLLSTCAHPNIISFLASDEDQGNSYLMTEFLDGGSLKRLINARKEVCRPFSERSVLYFFVQIALGLEYLHRHHILHRDVSSKNMLLSKKYLLKIAGFSFAKRYGCNVNQPVDDTCIGTPYYMAPEVMKKIPYGEKADVWSLGVILYELLTFRRPFEGDHVKEIANKVVTEEPDLEIIQTISPNCRILLGKMLHKNPGERPSIRQILQMEFIHDELEDYVQRYLKAAQAYGNNVDKNWADVIAAHVKLIRRGDGQSNAQVAVALENESAQQMRHFL